MEHPGHPLLHVFLYFQSFNNVDPKFPVPGHHSIANTKNELPTRKGWQCRSHVVGPVTIVHGWQVTSGMITVERLTTSTDVLGPMGRTGMIGEVYQRTESMQLVSDTTVSSFLLSQSL